MTTYIDRRDFEDTRTVRGARDTLEHALAGGGYGPGRTLGRLLRTARDGSGKLIMVFASTLDIEGTGARTRAGGEVVPGEYSAAVAVGYTCALHGWRVVNIERKAATIPARGEARGFEARTEVTICVDRVGAQIVDIDPVHGRWFAEGAYLGGPGAWGGYGVRNPAGPWYRFTIAAGLQLVPAAEAICALERAAARRCVLDADMVGACPV